MKRALLALLTFALLVPASAAAAPDGQGFVDRSAAYLQQSQNGDGGFGGSPKQPSDPTFTSWAALALAAAGVNPADLRVSGGDDSLSYLSKNVGKLSVTPDFERTLLVVAAAGEDGRSFGGHDLVQTILDRQLADGSFPHAQGGTQGTINATAFAVLSLAALDQPYDHPISQAVAWLRSKQNSSGGFGWAPGVPSDPDMTAAVMQALRAAGLGQTDTEQKALEYLENAQNEDGGFALNPGAESNTPSTAWTLQALWAAGKDPADWNQPGGTPLDFVASMQQPDGSVRQSASSDPNRVWVTAYALPAMAGRPLPIAKVARANPKAPLPSGAGGESDVGEPGANESTGVQSGGRGSGARLFTRPRPGGRGNPKSRPRRERRANSSGEPATEPQTAATGSSAKQSSLAEVATPGSDPGPPVGGGAEIVTGLPLSATATGAGPAASGLRTAVRDNDGGSATWILLLGVSLALGGGLIAEFRSVRWNR